MAIITRHGGEAHVMRPDRVMRTGVLSPMFGYQPQADVMAVAQAFTQGPPSGMELRGLNGFNPFQKIGLWFKAMFARGRAAQMVAVATAQGVAAPNTNMPAPQGPALPSAAQIAPQMQAAMPMLEHLMHDNSVMHRGIWNAAQEAAYRRYYSFYRAG